MINNPEKLHHNISRGIEIYHFVKAIIVKADINAKRNNNSSII